MTPDEFSKNQRQLLEHAARQTAALERLLRLLSYWGIGCVVAFIIGMWLGQQH